MKRVTIIMLVSVLIATGIFCTSSTKSNKIVVKHSNINAKGFALLELFTSQGCSSCPPADAVLARYAMLDDKQIIPIAFHVDYWNRLGWTDSFSNAKYSQRQRDYTDFLHSTVYTPQLVINGAVEMVGSETAQIEAAVTKVLKESKVITINIQSVTVSENKVTVKYESTGNISNNWIHATLVQQKATTYIKAGENKGVELSNYNVVRDFTSSDAKEKDDLLLRLPKGGTANNFMLVIFTQDKRSGNITAVSKTAL